MDSELLKQMVDLGGTVAVVGMFIWYLMHRNGKHDAAMKENTNTLKALNTSQEVHTRVLINVARKHGLDGDADDLMVNKK